MLAGIATAGDRPMPRGLRPPSREGVDEALSRRALRRPTLFPTGATARPSLRDLPAAGSRARPSRRPGRPASRSPARRRGTRSDRRLSACRVHRLRGDRAQAEGLRPTPPGGIVSPSPGCRPSLGARRTDLALPAIRRGGGSAVPSPAPRLLPAYVEVMLGPTTSPPRAWRLISLPGSPPSSTPRTCTLLAAHASGAVQLAEGDATGDGERPPRRPCRLACLEPPRQVARVRVIVGVLAAGFGTCQRGARVRGHPWRVAELALLPRSRALERVAGRPRAARRWAGAREVLTLVAAGKTNRAIAGDCSSVRRQLRATSADIFMELRLWSGPRPRRTPIRTAWSLATAYEVPSCSQLTLGVAEVGTSLALYGRVERSIGITTPAKRKRCTLLGRRNQTEQHAAPPEAWDAIAAGYDRYVAPQEAALATEALGLVGLVPGDRFLDVAAGTGGLSLPAARLGAEVLATDWSPAMIAAFDARVRDEAWRTPRGA